MNRLLVFAFLGVLTCCACAQVVDTTVCDVLKNPSSFNGKTIRVKGTVFSGFDQFIVKGEGCGQRVNAIWLSYPEGTKAKAGPAAMLQLQPAHNFSGTATAVKRAPVTLDKNKDFKQFDSLLSTPAKANGLCLGCVRYEVGATLVGRLDGEEPAIHRGSSGKITGISGFGNLNAYGARLVIQSVADVTPQEIDYAKGAKTGGGNGTTVAEDFGSTDLQAEGKRAIDAFGKQGDDNGVMVGFTPNENASKAEGNRSENSPDGVIYDCEFDSNRLKGPLMSVAMTHMGEHVADLRSPEAGLESASPYQLEFRAWVTTILGAIGAKQKDVTVTGGYLLWDAGWSNEAINTNTAVALTGFLTHEVMLAR